MKRWWMAGLLALGCMGPAWAATEEVEDPAPAAARTPELPPGTRVLREQAYGDDPLQRMDVFIPPGAQGAAPVLAMVHGGAWSMGDKASRGVVGRKAAHWLPRGWIFVSVNYRLLPAADPLQQASDVARAAAAIQSQATAWGGDPGKLVLMGHSAGAHLVALIGASGERARAYGLKPWLGTVALDSAALDVPQLMRARHPRLYDNAFGRQPGFWQEASPTDTLAAGAPPLLLVCSTQRSNACPQAQAHAQRAAALSLRAEVLRQNLSHREINVTLGQPGAYTEAVDAFLASLLR